MKPVDPGETKRGQNLPPELTMGENQQNHRASPGPISDADADGHPRMDKMIDLNMQPHRMHEQASNNQVIVITSCTSNLLLIYFWHGSRLKANLLGEHFSDQIYLSTGDLAD